MKPSTKRETVPRAALIAAGCLVCFSLAAVTASRLAGYKWEWRPEGTIVATRAIEFAQAPGGIVIVKDAETGQQLGSYTFNENAFMRTVMLGFRRERALMGSRDSTPYTIEQWDDGRVTVSDPTSGRSFEMAAFGRHQVETFAAFLH